MTPVSLALQANPEPLPDTVAASTDALGDAANHAAAAAGNGHIDVLQLVLHASLPVQLVMLLLLLASIASWLIIFRKQRVLGRAEREAEQFEERF